MAPEQTTNSKGDLPFEHKLPDLGPLDAPEPSDPAPNPVSSSPLGGGKETRKGIVLTRLEDLLNEPDEEVPWLVDRLLIQGGLSLLAGKPKAGKSTLARCIALSVASGHPVLGRATVPGPVIYLGLEDIRSQMKKHFQTMGATNEPLLIHAGTVGPSSLGSIRELRDLIREHKAVLVVVDILLRLIRVNDANDYAEMTNALNPILDLARETDCHLMLVHHAGKKNKEDLDAILGSVAIAGSVDTGMVVSRSNNVRTLESQQRYGDDLPRTVLELDPETQRIEAGPELAKVTQVAKDDAILKYLEEQSMATEEQIRTAVGGDTGKTAKRLREMIDAQQIVKTGGGKKGDPFKYSLPDTSCSLPPLGGNEKHEPTPPGVEIPELPDLMLGDGADPSGPPASDTEARTRTDQR